MNGNRGLELDSDLNYSVFRDHDIYKNARYYAGLGAHS